VNVQIFFARPTWLVTAPLLEMAERPEEIAGVVAHEIAHVTRKHGFRKIIDAKWKKLKNKSAFVPIAEFPAGK